MLSKWAAYLKWLAMILFLICNLHGVFHLKSHQILILDSDMYVLFSQALINKANDDIQIYQLWFE